MSGRRAAWLASLRHSTGSLWCMANCRRGTFWSESSRTIRVSALGASSTFGANAKHGRGIWPPNWPSSRRVLRASPRSEARHRVRFLRPCSATRPAAEFRESGKPPGESWRGRRGPCAARLILLTNEISRRPGQLANINGISTRGPGKRFCVGSRWRASPSRWPAARPSISPLRSPFAIPCRAINCSS